MKYKRVLEDLEGEVVGEVFVEVDVDVREDCEELLGTEVVLLLVL